MSTCLAVGHEGAWKFSHKRTGFDCNFPFFPLFSFPSLGCAGMWDNITCWKPASVGEIVFVKCPAFFRIINFEDGKVASPFVPLFQRVGR